MKKILSFLVLLFTFVIIRAQFEEAGKNVGTELWMIDERGNLETIQLQIIQNSELDYLHYRNTFDNLYIVQQEGFSQIYLGCPNSYCSYIVLETNANESTSKFSYNIYYCIMAKRGYLEVRKKTVEYVIKLWKEIGFENVTINRKEIFKLNNEVILDLKEIRASNEKVTLQDFLSCEQQRLYKLARSDGRQWINNNESQEMLVMLQVPTKYEYLNKMDDFVYECDSKALIFNLSGNAPEDNAKKLAEFIAIDNNSILTQIWSENELPPFSFLYHTLFYSADGADMAQFIETVYNNNNCTYTVNIEIFKFLSGREKQIPKRFCKYGFCNKSINGKKCYLMQNKDVKEAIIFIGNLEDFENIKSALKAGEELNYNKEDIMNYKISVVQYHTLNAPFLLAFYKVQKHFSEVASENLGQLLEKRGSKNRRRISG